MSQHDDISLEPDDSAARRRLAQNGYSARFYSFEEQPNSDSCWSLHAGPEGRVYAAACVEHTAGQTVTVLRYNEAEDRLDSLFDMDKVTGDLRDSGRATQCKIHYSFAPSPARGLLYAATHLSGAPKGERRYNAWGSWHDERRAFRGAYLAAYDTAADEVVSADLMIPREGCRCLCLDEDRQRMYALTYPRDHFVHYDLKTRTLHDVGRVGSVNSQCLFTDRQGRVHFTNDRGRFLRFDPERDCLEELPHQVAHENFQDGWHGVLYDAVASPEGDCVYILPWMVRPHLMRFWPEEGPTGRLEDLGPVNQPADTSHPISMSLDHAGGLVFGVDGCLYYVRASWPAGTEFGGDFRRVQEAKGIVVRLDPRTLEREEICVLNRPGASSSYATRGARDHAGNLYFGHVGLTPVGLFRMTVPQAPSKNAHQPLRMWG